MRPGNVALGKKTVGTAAESERSPVRDAGGLDSGQRPDLFQNLLIESDSCGLGVTAGIQVVGFKQHILCVEADIEFLFRAEAADKKSRGDEQQERQRDLRHSERI